MASRPQAAAGHAATAAVVAGAGRVRAAACFGAGAAVVGAGARPVRRRPARRRRLSAPVGRVAVGLPRLGRAALAAALECPSGHEPAAPEPRRGSGCRRCRFGWRAVGAAVVGGAGGLVAAAALAVGAGGRARRPGSVTTAEAPASSPPLVTPTHDVVAARLGEAVARLRARRGVAVVEVPGVGELLAGAGALDDGAELDRLPGLVRSGRGLRPHLQPRAFAQHDRDALRRLEGVVGVEVFGAGARPQEAGSGGGRVDERGAVGEGAGVERLVAAEQDRAAGRALDFEVGEAVGVGAGGARGSPPARSRSASARSRPRPSAARRRARPRPRSRRARRARASARRRRGRRRSPGRRRRARRPPRARPAPSDRGRRRDQPRCEGDRGASEVGAGGVEAGEGRGGGAGRDRSRHPFVGVGVAADA